MRNSDLLRHQLQTCNLRATCISEKHHAHGVFLSNPPRPSRGLLQGVNVVRRLQEHYGWEVQKVQAGLDQLRVCEQHFDTGIDLVENPVLAPSRFNRGP